MESKNVYFEILFYYLKIPFEDLKMYSFYIYFLVNLFSYKSFTKSKTNRGRKFVIAKITITFLLVLAVNYQKLVSEITWNNVKAVGAWLNLFIFIHVWYLLVLSVEEKN